MQRLLVRLTHLHGRFHVGRTVVLTWLLLAALVHLLLLLQWAAR